MRIAHNSWLRVSQYLKASPYRDMAVIAVGSIENHGRHMPLGTDMLIPDKILELMEEKIDILIAPTLPYGATDQLMGFPGTISLGLDGLTLVLTKITDALYSYGIRKFIILNGHGGNIKTIESVGLKLHQKGALLALINWWLIAGELNPKWKGGHGGAEETAGVMAVNPDLVDMEQLEVPQLLKNDMGDALPTMGFNNVAFKGGTISIPRNVHNYSDNGWIGPDAPTQATPQWGQEMLTTMAAYICDFIETFKDAPLPKQV